MSQQSEVIKRPQGQELAESYARCSSGAARERLSRDRARHMGVVPLSVTPSARGPILHFLCGEGKLHELSQALRFVVGCEVRGSEIPRDIVGETIERAYSRDGTQVEACAAELAALEGELPVAPDSSFAPESEVSRFLQSLIEYCFAANGTDIHILPSSSGTLVRMRQGSALLQREQPLCGSAMHQRIVTRVRVLAGLETASPKVVQDGAFTAHVGEIPIRVRVSILPSVRGDSVVLRLLRPHRFGAITELGIGDELVLELTKVLTLRDGLMVIGGATGSGKSTILYTLASEFLRQGRSVVSIEEPVEVEIPGIVQIGTDKGRGVTFEGVVRGVVRHDPDVVMIGELRDEASIRAATDLAITGHVVMATTHARTLSDIPTRLQELGMSKSILTSALVGAFSVTLVDTLCPECKVPDVRSSEGAFQPVGCGACGYRGLRGVVPVGDGVVQVQGVASMLHREPETLPAARTRQLSELMKSGEIASSAIHHGDPSP